MGNNKKCILLSCVILTKPTTFCKIIMSNIVGMCLRQVEYFTKNSVGRRRSACFLLFCGVNNAQVLTSCIFNRVCCAAGYL